MLIGIPPSMKNWSLNVDLSRRKEICIQNVRRQNHCVRTALDMIGDRHLDVSKMVTHRFKFKDTKKAFDLVSGYKDGVVKAMIEIQ